MLRLPAALLMSSILGIQASSAGIMTDIRISRSVPDMVAEVVWDAPSINNGSSLAPSASPKAILWESSATFTQKAAKAAEAFDVSGSLPAHVPAGALFTGWRLADGFRAFCTQAAEALEVPNKPAISVCLTYTTQPDGSYAYTGVKVRKNGKRLADSTEGALTVQAKLERGFAETDNVKAVPWRGPVNFFSYLQSGGAGIVHQPTSAGTGMAVNQFTLGNRAVLGAIQGNVVTLEYRSFKLDDFTNSISKQKDSGYKEATVTTDLSNGPQTVSLGGGTFVVSKTTDGIAVEAKVPIPQNWSIDPVTGRLLIGGEPYVVGAQEI